MAITGKDLLSRRKQNTTKKTGITGSDLLEARRLGSSAVNDDYISSYIKDTESYIKNAQKQYEGIGWGNAADTYAKQTSTYDDLEKRRKTINSWLKLNQNKVANYDSLAKSLADLEKSTADVYGSFKSAKDYYSQWDTQEAYDAYKKTEDEKKAILEAPDFKQYSQAGADIKNPTYAEAMGSDNFLGWVNPFAKKDEIGNIVTFSRENADTIEKALATANSNLDASTVAGDYRYRYMTDDEVGIYNYYLGKGDKERADAYLSSLSDSLEQRWGGKIADRMSDNTFLEMTFAVNAGLDQFASGIGNLDNFFKGTEADSTTATQYASGMIREDLGTFGKGAYDLITTTSNMLPSVLSGAAANIILPGAGTFVGAGLMGASATGNAYAEMRNLGYDENQARGYATLVGASEAALSALFSGVKGIGGKLTNHAVKNFISGIDNGFARVAIKYGSEMFSEGFEESVQSVLEPMFKRLTTGDEFDVDWGEVAYSGLLGAISAGVLNAAPTTFEIAQTMASGKNIKANEGVERLKKLGTSMSADSAAYKIANKITDKTGAYKIGMLLNEVGATLSEQNMSDIRTSLESKGVAPKDAATITKWMQRVVEGKELTKRQAAAIEANDVLTKTLREEVLNPSSTIAQRVGEFKTLYDLAQTKATPTKAEKSAPTVEEAPEVTENAPETEKASEGKISASEDNTKKPADTDNISEVIGKVGDKYKVRLNDGTELLEDAAEMSPNTERLFATAKDLGLNAESANAFLKSYDGSMSAADYAQAYKEAYQYGEYNFAESEMRSDGFSALLSESQRKIAYESGRIDRKYKTEAKQAEIKKTDKKQNKGKLHNTFAPTNERQKASLKALGVLAEALGIDIYTFESETNAEGKHIGKNGWYDPKDNSIHIDVYAGEHGHDTILFTAAHELTHMIRRWSPAKFKVFADFLMEKYGEQGKSVSELVRAQIRKAEKNGRTLTFGEAYEEVVADSCEAMLADGDAIAKIAELKAKDKSLREKIKDYITKLVARIKAAYEGLEPDSKEGKFVASLLDSAEELRDLWVEAVVDASEAYNEGEIVSIDETSESVTPAFSERTWTQSDYDNDGIGSPQEAVVPSFHMDEATKMLDEYRGGHANYPVAQGVVDKFVREYEGVKYSDRDSLGNELSTEQQAYFKDSKVRDKKGNLMVLYHGTTANFNVFKKGDVGYHFGTKGAARGRVGYGKNVNIKEVYLNITNPIVFDEDLGSWDADYRLTRELYDRGIMTQAEAESVLLSDDKRYRRTTEAANKKLASVLTSKGYDGIAYSNTFETKKVTTSYIVFNSNQAKEITNKTPTASADIRYSDRDSSYMDAVNRGDMDTAQRMVDGAAKAAGYDYHLYHGTNADFTKFDLLSHGGVNGKGEGYGIYLAANREISAPYGKNVIDAYTKFNRLAEGRKKTLSYNEVKKLVKRSCELEAKQMIDDEEYDSISEALKDTWVSNVVYTYGYSSIEQIYADVANKLWKENDNDGDLINEMMALTGANYDYKNALKFYETVLTPTTGIDGFHYIWGNKDGSGEQNDIYLAFNSEQIKSADPVTYDDNGNVIPLSQRFNAEDPDIRFSERDSDTVSNRTLLAEALEGITLNDIEKKKLADYKANAEQLDAAEARLKEVRAEIKDISFSKGTRDKQRLSALKEEATQLTNRINIYDRILINLETTSALKGVLDRAKADVKAREKAKAKADLDAYKERSKAREKEIAEAYRESRAANVEGRRKTEMRHKILKVVHDLNKVLENPTKEKHIPIALQKPVAEALAAINMDTVTAEERLAKYDAAIAKAEAEGNTDKVKKLKETRANIESQGHNLEDKLTRLYALYELLKNSEDPLIKNSYDENIAGLISEVQEKVGDTPIRKMTLAQLNLVYDMFKALKKTISDTNKMFLEAKAEKVSDNASNVATEILAKAKAKDKEAVIKKWTKKYLWSILKPTEAMDFIGSDTFSSLFANVRAGEETWARDTNEAKAFFQETARKHGYWKWDFEKKYGFVDKNNRRFELTLEQMLSLYAYSKRDQADLHLDIGGFVFDDNIEVVEKKYGLPVKYNMKTQQTYNLTKNELDTIINELGDGQKAFVDEMQTFLSETMGDKGNEVSLAMYDIKLFNEKNYFPLKTAKYYIGFDAEKKGLPNLKNSGFSKKLTPNANNPIVLSNFLDVWGNHVNEMSTYHAFVLPLEDFMRVFNYTERDGGYDSVRAKIVSTYGKAAAEYIENLMTDLNGGARSDYYTGFFGKPLALFKKSATFLSLSVIIQQPSSIARAFAYIDPKYFVTNPETKNYKSEWEVLKKYAPVAIIKEMGSFDIGIGRQSTKWITAREYNGFKEKAGAIVKDSDYRDDVLSKGPAIADMVSWVYIWEAAKNKVATEQNLEGEALLEAAGKVFTETIVRTQVYDSVLSKSGIMRSKSDFAKLLTAFMAEPITALNLAFSGLMKGIRGDRKAMAKCFASVGVATILNAILVSLVYAARDDDEDENYGEKYLESLTAEVLEGVNILTYMPYIKDLWSYFQGYSVDRADLTVFEKLIDSLNGLFSDTKSGWAKARALTESISTIFGLPVRNVLRDAEALFNVTKGIIEPPEETDGAGAAALKGLRSASPKVMKNVYKLPEKKPTRSPIIEATESEDFSSIKDIIRDEMESGKTESEAKSALRSRMTSYYKPLYVEAYASGDTAEMARIRKILARSGLYGKTDDVIETAKNWLKK